jgi:hypothetical protein
MSAFFERTHVRPVGNASELYCLWNMIPKLSEGVEDRAFAFVLRARADVAFGIQSWSEVPEQGKAFNDD